METITTKDGIQDFWIKSAGKRERPMASVCAVSQHRIDYSFLSAIQMAQSGQLTLELPYAIIGLGSTPNFVEKLTIAIPPNIQSVLRLVHAC